MFFYFKSIKILESDDCNFFKFFHPRYMSISFSDILNSHIYTELTNEDIEQFISDFEAYENLAQKRIYSYHLCTGIEIESTIFNDYRSFPLKKSLKELFPGISNKNILINFNQIQSFFSLFSLTESILTKALKEFSVSTKDLKNKDLSEALFDLLENKNLKDTFFEYMGDKTYITTEDLFLRSWDLLRVIRNIIGHSYGVLSNKNINRINKLINALLDALSTNDGAILALWTLSNQNTLLNPYSSPPEYEDIINRSDLKENSFILIDQIFCNFTNSFFLFFIESLNEVLKNSK